MVRNQILMKGEKPMDELFNTKGLFTLTGNQPVKETRFEKSEQKPERLIKLPRPTTDELYERHMKGNKKITKGYSRLWKEYENKQ